MQTTDKPRHVVVFPTILNEIEYEFPECIVVIKKLKRDERKANRHKYIEAWAIALQTRERKCELCGIDKPLEIHHIDGNANNNESSNLKILCANCHYTLGHGRI